MVTLIRLAVSAGFACARKHSLTDILREADTKLSPTEARLLRLEVAKLIGFRIERTGPRKP